MSAFRFSLQRVLDMRQDAERAAATALAAAQQHAESARAAVSALEAMRDANRARVTATGAATVGHLRQLAFVVEQAERRVQLASGACAQADAGVAQSRDALSHAFQQRRVLDRLREKSLEVYRAGEVQLDRQTMDDIALGRFGRTGATD